MGTMFQRHLRAAAERAMNDRPVVFVQGARQTGKSTLAEAVAADRRGMQRVTLDDLTTLFAARRDPVAFIASFTEGVLIDEVQRAPELLLPIKQAVDRRRTAGRFLLTGSTQVLALPRLADSLAGRMEVLTLWPLSQAEIERNAVTFLERAFGDAPPTRPVSVDVIGLENRVLRGGYPDAVLREDPERRAAWFDSYASALVQGDIRELARIDSLGDLDRLLRLTASRTSRLTNFAEFSRVLGIAQTTLKRYMQLLESVHLVSRVEPWAPTTKARLARTPKLLFHDSGLAANLAGIDRERLQGDSVLRGQFVESFVRGELHRICSGSRLAVRLHHFRANERDEVDNVLEGPGGRVVGVEVKAGTTLDSRDTRGLDSLRRVAGKRFHRGVILYGGRDIVPLGENLWAVPIPALWSN